MKITNATIYVCDRCKKEERFKGRANNLIDSYGPPDWGVDSTNNKNLCPKCWILLEKFKQAFYNPDDYMIEDMDYGMQVMGIRKEVIEDD